jgi:hypothetical protein
LGDGAAAPSVVEPDWLNERRDRAKELALELELPSQKQRGWEFTDLSGFELDGYEEAVAGVEGLEPSDGEGPIVLPLAEAAVNHPEVVREHLGEIVPPNDAFTARNESRWRDGFLLYVPAGARLE